jgi:hypothetical protein
MILQPSFNARAIIEDYLQTSQRETEICSAGPHRWASPRQWPGWS